MRGRWILLGLTLALSASPVAAANTPDCCSWDFPASLNPTGFVATVTPSTGSATSVQVAPVHGEACGANAGNDTFCTNLQCPGNGLFTLSVRALAQGQESAESEPIALACLGSTTQCTCIAGPVTTATTPDTPTATDTPPALPPGVEPAPEDPALVDLPADELEKKLKEQETPTETPPSEDVTPMPDVTLPPLVTTNSTPEPSTSQEPPTREQVQQQLSTIRQTYLDTLKQIDVQYMVDLGSVSQLPTAQQAAAALEAYNKALAAQLEAYTTAQTRARSVYTRVGQRP